MTRCFTFTALAIGSLATTSLAQTASPSQFTCGPRDQVITKLETAYGESRMGAGLRGQATILEIWASATSGSWTILVTNTEGVSCVMAAGENWHGMPALPVKQGAPA